MRARAANPRSARLLPFALALLFATGACQVQPGRPDRIASQPATPPGTWLTDGSTERADALLEAFDRADTHGLDPARYRTRALEEALAEATDPRRRARAERRLTAAYLRWARDLAEPAPGPDAPVIAEPAAGNPAPDNATLMARAAAAPDMAAHLAALERRHPFYNRLRTALTEELAGDADPARVATLTRNLDRARTLPLTGRHILVDAASQRLWMFDSGRPVDRMRVIVGTPDMETPSMIGNLASVVARPYWHVPEDLTQIRIAPKVVAAGLSHLKTHRYAVLSDWTDHAVPIDAASIDWKAAAARKLSVRVRQEPGPHNMMGQMKFMFANDLGIYLHDTPDRALFRETNRARSAGCVRVEDWKRLARWLFGGTVPKGAGAPEEELFLPRPVPIHISYFTVDMASRKLTPVADVYARDPAAIAPAVIAAST